jgi:hypothetical protein
LFGKKEFVIFNRRLSFYFGQDFLGNVSSENKLGNGNSSNSQNKAEIKLLLIARKQADLKLNSTNTRQF